MIKYSIANKYVPYLLQKIDDKASWNRDVSSASFVIVALCLLGLTIVRKSSLDLNFLPISSSAVGTPVVECGEIQYLNKNFGSFSVMLPFSSCIWRKACLNVCTALSASPLNEGWYGAENVCLIPFCFMNSSLVKVGPLSVTICCGRPCVENIECNLAVAFSLVIVSI